MIHSILKKYWGYSSFRPLQEEIIQHVLDRKDGLALLPTGGGKSLCFQVPAMAMDGVCLVISPLIALMKDQVENLRKKGITAFAVHSGMNRREVMNTLALAGNSNCKFLYVSPERLETNLFKEYLPSLGVSMLAVDEAHCISQWGYDFRPSYLKIAALRDELQDVPVLALTASATSEVQQDIADKLLFTGHKIFRQSFARPELSYSVFNVSSRINRIIDILKKVKGCGIIYCKSRKRTREISDQLNMNGIVCDYYHAGLLQAERNNKQDAWLKNETRVMACTNAFGMGIDKPDVRVVIHADVPDCLENYYQEAGRAGRDGKRSYAVLLYNDNETKELKESLNDRFPPPAEIKKIYHSLMNHLQIPAGSGEGNYYELDLALFVKKFSLPLFPVVSVLKTLEQEELLYFNEQVFVPAKLQVTAGRERLNEMDNENPEIAVLLKTLLRIYEGIIDQPVSINEKVIAGFMKVPVQEVTDGLVSLHTTGVVKYVPQKEKPQVYLLSNRVRAEDLMINITNYNKRKKKFEARIAAMLDYVNSSSVCRSVTIGNYFGDNELKACGICDTCLDLKKKSLTGDEFEKIHLMLIEMLGEKPLSFAEIMGKMNGISKEKTNEVIRFLQAEEKIFVNDDGKLGTVES
jgi:ATP-dependent DNA helicase RecQ